jgi:pimeloyl-ACP methyl ester carboxylesterase
MQNAFQRPSRNQTTHLSICFNSLARLALTENELKSINVPVTVVVGDRDPVEKLYVIPLQQVRKDWPVTEIKGAGHITCVANPQFKEEVKNWLDKQTR